MAEQPQKWPLKIVQAGHIRSGTASLAHALEKLGYGPVFHFMKNYETAQGTKINDIVIDWMFENSPNLDAGHVDWDALWKKIQCYSALDSPIYLYWEQIFKQNPSVKVIVCIRTPWDKWYDSVVYTYHNVIYSPWWYEAVLFLDNVHKIGWYGHNPARKLKAIAEPPLAQVLGGTGGWKSFLNDKEGARRRYYQRLEYIKSVVPKDQLLIFDVKQGWHPLAEFLNMKQEDIPTEPFPRVNDGKSLVKVFAAQRRENVRKFVMYKLVPILMLVCLLWFRRWRHKKIPVLRF